MRSDSALLRAAVREILLAEADIGDYPFDDQVIRRPGGDRPREPNTPEEQALFRALMRWSLSGGRDYQMPPEALGTLRELMRDPKWSRVFHEPSRGTLYRGMTVPGSTLARWTGLSRGELESVGRGVVPARRGRGAPGLESWTRDPEVAWGFAEGEPLGWSVVVSAAVRDNPGVFFDLAGMIEEVGGLWGLAEHDGEDEVVALGPVVPAQLAWARQGVWEPDDLARDLEI